MAKKKKEVSKASKLLSKILVLSVIVLAFLVVLKANPSLKEKVNKKLFNSNFSFAKINELYEKYLGSALPLKNNDNTQTVSTTINYSKKEDYKDGVKLTVDDNQIITSLDSGLVIFVGEKENYGNTVIIQRPDNVEVWYCNLKDVNVSLYDYIKESSTIGVSNDNYIYMVFTKDGEILDYKEYI